MVAHRRLRKTHRLDEVADASLTFGCRPDQAQELEPRGIGQHPQRTGKPIGFLAVQRRGKHLRAALGVDRLDQLHEEILTFIDGTVNVSIAIDTKEVFARCFSTQCCPEGCCPEGCC